MAPLDLDFCFAFLTEEGLEDGTRKPTGSVGDGGAVEEEPGVVPGDGGAVEDEPGVVPGDGERDPDDKVKSSIELDEALLGL